MSNKLKSFSNKDRAERIVIASKKHYDLIVIGGGITGAGIALDAALRGLAVLLLEKKDFASGTSSKSTKLIHGGLRYLKQLEFGLVRETGLERMVAHKNACHLVHPENMLLPIVHNGTFNKWTASLAISVYDRLAKVPSKDRKVVMSKEDTMQMEPLLMKDKVKSAIVYSEYRTDDARLTIEVIKAAKRNSAEAFNYMEVIDFSPQKNNAYEVSCRDNLTKEEICLSAKTVVNATGPWVDGVRALENINNSSNLRLSKGSHIVFDKSKLPIRHSTYFDAFDGRMIFAIPRQGVVYVGTTDTNYNADLDKLVCSLEDANYLLSAVNNFFDVPELLLEDIESTWSGLRPLIQQKGKAPTEVSRKDEIFISKQGLISIAGGKLTGFRKMAQRVVDLVFERNKIPFKSCTTEHYEIHHSPYHDYSQFEAEILSLNKKYADYLPEGTIEFLLSAYGKDAHDILESANLSSGALPENEDRIIDAQLTYAIEYESILHPMDFLDRRTGWLFFDITRAKKYAARVSQRLGKELKLSEDVCSLHLTESLAEISTNSLDILKKA